MTNSLPTRFRCRLFYQQQVQKFSKHPWKDQKPVRPKPDLQSSRITELRHESQVNICYKETILHRVAEDWSIQSKYTRGIQSNTSVLYLLTPMLHIKISKLSFESRKQTIKMPRFVDYSYLCVYRVKPLSRSE